MVTQQQIDPRGLVARIIAELDANPPARELLLRALLTEEFLGMPARLTRIEDKILPSMQDDINTLKDDVNTLKEDVSVLKEDVSALKEDVSALKEDVSVLKEDVSVLKEDVSVLKEDVSGLKVDVGRLKGMALEADFAHRATSWLNREFGFLRNRVMHGKSGVFQQYGEEFADAVADSVEAGRITVEQGQRLFDTDVIVRCRRPGETEPTWVAMEVAARIDEDDIDRAERSAEALRAVFGEAALPVVAGERIDPPDVARARAAGVDYIVLSE